MQEGLKVKIESSKIDKSEYTIKDKDNIIIGRFNIIEMNKLSKRCNIRFRFYREHGEELLRETLKSILKAVFKNLDIYKINIITAADIDLNPFLDLGLTLQGILTENEYQNGVYVDDLIMGISRMEYNESINAPIIELVGENIVLKNLTPANDKELLEYYINNKEHLEHFEPKRDKEFYELETQRQLLNESYRQFLNGTNIELGIFKDNKLIGKIKLSNIVYGIFKNGILGYSIDKNYQGKGYMKESVKLFLKYAFKECDLHRIEASVLINNERSKGVLKACGFKLLGVNEKYLFIDAKWRDHETYYITKENLKNIEEKGSR